MHNAAEYTVSGGYAKAPNNELEERNGNVLELVQSGYDCEGK